MNVTSQTWNIKEENDLVTLTIPSFDRTGKVHHCFSTRLGGVSEGVYASMNLGLHRGDDPKAVMENFYRISVSSGIYMGDMVFSQQVHGDRIMYVDQQYRGSGLMRPSQLENVDGLITDRKHVALVTFHADCVPVFFLDPLREVIGLAHAGWKGTLLQISASMVHRMKEDFDCEPGDILVGIGPSIGPCCFEVGEDVASRFEKTIGPSVVRPAGNKGKYYVDLWQSNAISLQKAGITKDHLTITDLCTKCHPDLFHSHRYAGDKRGTQAAFLELY